MLAQTPPHPQHQAIPTSNRLRQDVADVGLVPWHFAPRPLWPRLGLDRIYAVPRETRSSADYARLRHWDLPAMSAFWLSRERWRVEHRLSLERDAATAAWLVARIEAIDGE